MKPVLKFSLASILILEIMSPVLLGMMNQNMGSIVSQQKINSKTTQENKSKIIDWKKIDFSAAEISYSDSKTLKIKE